MQFASRQELNPRERLRQLLEIYALRTCELSEAIAALGGRVSAGREIDASIIEIENLSLLVEQAAANLSAFVGQRQGKSLNE